MPIVGPSWAFIHNPKAAGKTIWRALGGHDAPPKHAPAYTIPSGVFKFGFVRNPWDRQLSLYTYLCEQRYSWYDADAMIRAGFNNWLLGLELHNPGDFNWPPAFGAPGLQRRPQWWWLNGCNYVGRFENLQVDFDLICAEIGVQPQKLTRTNASGHRPYCEVYTPETAAAVAEWFAPDIQAWGYEF